MPGIAKIMGDGKLAWYVSSIFVSILFGLGHYYQGWAGVLQTGSVSLCLCLAYVWSGRNLWVPILAHGLIDTLGFITLYAR